MHAKVSSFFNEVKLCPESDDTKRNIAVAVAPIAVVSITTSYTVLNVTPATLLTKIASITAKIAPKQNGKITASSW